MAQDRPWRPPGPSLRPPPHSLCVCLSGEDGVSVHSLVKAGLARHKDLNSWRSWTYWVRLLSPRRRSLAAALSPAAAACRRGVLGSPLNPQNSQRDGKNRPPECRRPRAGT